ncbi:MAG: phosphatase PAP2 family protein [Deltaproteobacteria bacterium HGW-Deltaproteobacteria-1]|jgi:membrane-associated phospholipid phosphatase|nr:MAG: phosphatase PAP2 family protein [Deltaproteobacteria bacterium HGW-Deltaproteobacteria-1]
MKKRWIAAGLLLFGGVLSAISYYFWDVQLMYYCQGLNRSLVGAAEIITQAGDSLWYFILLVPAFIVIRFVWKNEQWSAKILYLLLCISLSGILNIGIKWLTGRNRPINLIEDGVFGFDFFRIIFLYETTSFPSGHTVTAFALATAFSFLYPRWSFPAFLIAVMIGLSRVVLTAHYLSDVIAGAVVGVICSLGVKYLFDRFYIELNESV